MNIDELIKQGTLTREPVDPNLIAKEIAEADSDLQQAERSLTQNNFKWAIIQSYYSMFHAAKAVLFSMGLREKKHFAVTSVLEILSTDGKLEARFVNEFAGTQHDREEADYHYHHNKSSSENALSAAQDFVKRMKSLLASKKL